MLRAVYLFATAIVLSTSRTAVAASVSSTVECTIGDWKEMDEKYQFYGGDMEKCTSSTGYRIYPFNSFPSPEEKKKICTQTPQDNPCRKSISEMLQIGLPDCNLDVDGKSLSMTQFVSDLCGDVTPPPPPPVVPTSEPCNIGDWQEMDEKYQYFGGDMEVCEEKTGYRIYPFDLYPSNEQKRNVCNTKDEAKCLSSISKMLELGLPDCTVYADGKDVTLTEFVKNICPGFTPSPRPTSARPTPRPSSSSSPSPSTPSPTPSTSIPTPAPEPIAEGTPDPAAGSLGASSIVTEAPSQSNNKSVAASSVSHNLQLLLLLTFASLLVV